jgi:hypothetical protein
MESMWKNCKIQPKENIEHSVKKNKKEFVLFIYPVIYHLSSNYILSTYYIHMLF